MNFEGLIGEVIDAKYRIERQLGKGGMGTVYLATHIGTERPVAVKVIAPQFMQRTEFVERFRREARAAGRLRHPNVVDVTDFGIAEGRTGRIAYLVMEYLDGCTLGEVLEEEKKLPLDFTIDILAQVCSAVHAAHEQGIIHRDLKPDNIWLEPNQRGGYTVKVLDFGIAKLEEGGGSDESGETNSGEFRVSGAPTSAIGSGATNAGNSGGGATLISEKGTAIIEPIREDGATSAGGQSPGGGATLISEKGTAIIEPIREESAPVVTSENATALMTSPATEDDEPGTAIFGDKKTQMLSPEDGTRLIEPLGTDEKVATQAVSAELTRVGAVLGTPLYMSPEQCRGERLDVRSDVYSLAVIAYQMLGGATPFEGDFTSVMRAHKETPPPPLVAKGVPRKIKRVIHTSLSKDPAMRPATAEAFGSQLEAQSDGITSLIRRALVLYMQHFPKFVGMTSLFLLPVFIFSIIGIVLTFLTVGESIPKQLGEALIGVNGTVTYLMALFTTSMLGGAITWTVAQNMAVPLRPVRIKPALTAVAKRWKSFAWTVFLNGVLAHLGILACGIGLLVLSVCWSLSSSVVIMENLSGLKALGRSYQLVKRSIGTTIAALLILFVIPILISASMFFFITLTAKTIDSEANLGLFKKGENPVVAVTDPEASEDLQIKIDGKKVSVGPKDVEKKDVRTKLILTGINSISQIIWLPLHVLVASFTSIILALLYLKTRLAGGESMRELLGRFEDSERQTSKWQQRVQERLANSGRILTPKT